MKLTDRERVLVLVMPAILVVSSYSVWYNVTLAGVLRDARAAYNDAVSKQVSPAAAMEKAAAVKKVRDEVASLEHRKAALQAEAAAMVGQQPRPGDRLQAVERLNAVFSRHGLRLMREEAAKSNAGQSLPKSLRDALGRLGKSPGGDSSDVRAMEFQARFPDVLEVLNELARGDVPVVPIGLAMAEADLSSQWRTWTLWIWL